MSRVRLPATRAGRIATIAAAALLAALILSQLFLPGLGERAIEGRLTERGGSADVSLSAKPAARLLWGDGESVDIDATGLDLDVDLSEDPVAFDDLDRFDEVQILIGDSRAGPVELETFALRRSGDEPYALQAVGTTSLAAMAESAAGQFGVPGSEILGTFLGASGVGSDLDIDLDMLLSSEDGRIQVVSGGGEIAGVEAGPIAEAITSAIVISL